MRSKTRRPSGESGVRAASTPSRSSAARDRFAISGFQQVDAQIERRAFVERRHLAREPAAQRRLQMRREPGRDNCRAPSAACRGVSSFSPRQRLDESRLLARQRLRPEAVAVAGADDRRRRPVLDQRQRRQHAPARVARQAARPAALDPPVERRAPAQHGIDVLGDRAAVARAGEAVAAEIVGDDVVGRGAALLDLVQQPDRRLDAGAGVREQLSVVSSQHVSLEIRQLTAADDCHFFDISCR